MKSRFKIFMILRFRVYSNFLSKIYETLIFQNNSSIYNIKATFIDNNGI